MNKNTNKNPVSVTKILNNKTTIQTVSPIVIPGNNPNDIMNRTSSKLVSKMKNQNNSTQK